VKISAIGEADTLASSLMMKNGVRDTFVTDPKMFSLDKLKNVTLPAYAGATPLRFARPAPDAKADEAQRQSEAAGRSDQGLPIDTDDGDLSSFRKK
jgi:hypothetical protein